MPNFNNYLELRIMNNQPNPSPTTQNQFIHIKLCFGDDSNSSQLVKLRLTFEMGKQDEELRKQIRRMENNGDENDFFVKITFNVTEGREKEAIEYLQRGQNQPDKHQRKSLNYIQRMLHDPGRYGAVYFKSSDKKDGKVNVYYILYDEEVPGLRDQQFDIVKFWEHHPRLQLDFFLRGEEMKDFEQKSIIEPNYSEVNLKVLTTSQEIFTIISKIDPQLSENPLFQIIGRVVKKITLKSKLNIFQKLSKMYKEIVESSEDHVYQEQKINNNNLLKKNVEVIFSWKKFGLLKIKVQFEKEQSLHIILNKLVPIFKDFFNFRD